MAFDIVVLASHLPWLGVGIAAGMATFVWAVVPPHKMWLGPSVAVAVLFGALALEVARNTGNPLALVPFGLAAGVSAIAAFVLALNQADTRVASALQRHHSALTPVETDAP